MYKHRLFLQFLQFQIKDHQNQRVVDDLIREVKVLNPEFLGKLVSYFELFYF